MPGSLWLPLLICSNRGFISLRIFGHKDVSLTSGQWRNKVGDQARGVLIKWGVRHHSKKWGSGPRPPEITPMLPVHVNKRPRWSVSSTSSVGLLLVYCSNHSSETHHFRATDMGQTDGRTSASAAVSRHAYCPETSRSVITDMKWRQSNLWSRYDLYAPRNYKT